MSTAVMTHAIANTALMGMGAAPAARHSRTAEALLSLMALYEQGEGVQDAEESETELMVLLSGMVGVDTSLLPGE
jgi:hypothetical protein